MAFALIDSRTLQSGFSGVRLESDMFTEESFRALRNVLTPDGVLVVTPRLKGLAEYPDPPSEVTAFNQGAPLAPPVRHARDTSIVSATDNWPFLYMQEPHLPRHYTNAHAMVLLVSILSVFAVVRGAARNWSWEFFFLGAGFMLLETKSIIQFALLWGSTWVVASLTIAAVLVMALAANWTVAHVEIRRPRAVGAALLALLAVNYLVPVGTLAFDSRLTESVVYSLLVFSPIFCAGPLFGSSIKRSPDITVDYGANLLGAMVSGVAAGIVAACRPGPPPLSRRGHQPWPARGASTLPKGALDVADASVLVGKPVIKGTRISVELVRDLLASGYTPSQIRQAGTSWL